MNSPDNREEELRRREQELFELENELRLRELEAELNQRQQQQPLYQNARQPSQGVSQRRNRKWALIGKFSVLFVTALVAVKVAAWLTGAIIIGSLALSACIAGLIITGSLGWVSYKLFFESKTK